MLLSSVVTNGQPSCILIGEDHLLLQCAEILLSKHFLIVVIISYHDQVREWAKKNNISWFQSFVNAEAYLYNKQIDYLFSIVNSKIIPTTLLEKISKLSINYHHSPLPKYAGVNATSWAIINHEKNHGVTWHVMSDKIDGGDIIKQELFMIEDQETAFSLSLKCNQYAVLLFEELAFELLNNSLPQPRPQDLHLRSYYSLSQKPLGNGWIDWECPAEEIEQYFRAFSLGSLNNRLSLLKFNLSHDIYIVNELKLKNGSESLSPPGSLLEITSAYWRISTTTKDIIITQIITVDGNNCSLEELASRYNLVVSSILYSPSETQINLFTTVSTNLSKYESYWTRTIANFNSANLPFLTADITNTKLNTFELLQVLDFSDISFLNAAHLDSHDYDPVTFFLTIWLIYLYRLGNKVNLGVSLRYFELFQLPEINDFFSNEVPFQIEFNNDINFDQAFQLVANQLRQTRGKKTYLKDIFYRYQSINNYSQVAHITVILEDIYPVMDNNLRGSLVLKISNLHKRLEWYLETSMFDSNVNLLDFAKQSSQHIKTIMLACLSDRSLPIKDLPLLTTHEKETILVKWNNTRTDYPREKNISSLLDDSFIRRPTRIAIQFEETSISYAILKQQIDKLSAYFLDHMNIRQQQPIIVYMSRGIEWIISVLAILKIGAIYIPVVDNTPLQRFKTILEDATARCVISSENLIKKITHHITPDVQCLDVKTFLIDHYFCDSTPTFANFSSEHTAYILYTSGTTGKPKGVVIRHVSLVNLVFDQIRKLTIHSNSKVLQFASMGFDASIWEIFSTFIVGGTLCIPSDNQLLIAHGLTEIINKFNITLATLPPTILQTIHPTEVKSLTTVVTAGEPCPKDLAHQWKNHLTLINAYGPTETTVCSTMGVLRDNNFITIGKPIANTQVYVFDDYLHPVPVGVTGELYVGGDCVAVGYLNQDKLTNQYFIPNPFTINGKDKLYKTKDLVRWLPDGNLEYIGRVDNQIKIRGFRIELEAIEVHILHHDYISQCAVLLKHNNNLGKFLVAYLVSEDHVDLNLLRKSLKESIPHYMIPNFFVVLDALPLNSNGKIDRKLLPEPELTPNINDHPITEIEKKLMQIWLEILDLEQIGIYDDFFNLGGNSLLLSQLILAIREKLQAEIHFSLFLKSPTIASVAELVTKKFHNVLDENYNRRFLKDTQLSPEIGFVSCSIKPHNTCSVLLTGATGFLGVHLLYELQHKKNLNIYCLVRADSLSAGKKIIEESIAHYSLNFFLSDRIILILGDLSKPYLGMTQELYRLMAKEIDEIYHNGAFVNHLYNYEMLRPTNVLGTNEILKLANNYKNKRIHHISTLSAVCNFIGKDGHVFEEFIPSKSDIPPSDGYSQTKWVSEKLLTEATNRNFAINIYRPGWIFGNTLTGHFPPTNNHLLSLIKGCIQLGIAPDWNIRLNILPVDFVSRLIVAIGTSTMFKNKVFNLSNRNNISWKEIIHSLNDFGYDVKLVNNNIWIDSLNNIGRNNALFNLLPLYLNAGDGWEKSLNKISLSHDSNTQQAMDTFSLKYPVIDKQLLFKCFTFLKQ